MPWTLERFQREIKKFDPLLRARVSLLDPSTILVERKAARETKCIPTPKERRGIDNWVRDCAGYVPVTKLHRWQMNQMVFAELRAHDMWTYGGAGYYADMLERQEAAEQAKLEKEQSEALQAAGEEAYDRGMIRQGDIVSSFHQKEVFDEKISSQQPRSPRDGGVSNGALDRGATCED